MQTVNNVFTVCYTKVEKKISVQYYSYFDSRLQQIKIRLLDGKFILNFSKSKTKASTVACNIKWKFW